MVDTTYAFARFEELRKIRRWTSRDFADGHDRNYRLSNKTMLSVYSSDTDQPGAIEVAFAEANLASQSNRSRTDTANLISHLQKNIGAFASPKTRYRYPRVSLSTDAQVDATIAAIKDFLDGSALEPISKPPMPAAQEHIVDERLLKQILTRRGQASFRSALLQAYGAKCAVTGCSAEAVLEAAHILPFSEQQSYKTTGGILLRADIHILFDLALLSFEPESKKVVLAPELLPSYEVLQGSKLRMPEDSNQLPEKALLMAHYER